MTLIDIVFRAVVFVAGTTLVILILVSAIRTFVLPRSASDRVTRAVFLSTRKCFDLFSNRAMTYEERDQIMALYAPVTLLILPVVWLALVLIGYMAMFWATGADSLSQAFEVSGSSLLTLGYSRLDSFVGTLLSFTEATIGLILIAVLIAYLPTMYTTFSRRETAVTLLEVRAGAPPSALTLFARYNRLKNLDRLHDLWIQWENFFADIEESHTSLAALAFFRSPRSHRSWITAVGAVLDAASLASSTIDIPDDYQAALCIRAGYLALRHIADFFRMQYNANPAPTDPISISKLEFMTAYQELKSEGIPVKADVEQCWRDFAGWRVNYDTVLLKLCALTMAPYAPWSSDRSIRTQNKPLAWKRVKSSGTVETG